MFIGVWLNKMLFSFREKNVLTKTITKRRLGEKRCSLSIKFIKDKYTCEKYCLWKMDSFITIIQYLIQWGIFSIKCVLYLVTLKGIYPQKKVLVYEILHKLFKL